MSVDIITANLWPHIQVWRWFCKSTPESLWPALVCVTFQLLRENKVDSVPELRRWHLLLSRRSWGSLSGNLTIHHGEQHSQEAGGPGCHAPGWQDHPKINPKAGFKLYTFMSFDWTVKLSIITIMSDIIQQYVQSSHHHADNAGW